MASRPDITLHCLKEYRSLLETTDDLHSGAVAFINQTKSMFCCARAREVMHEVACEHAARRSLKRSLHTTGFKPLTIFQANNVKKEGYVGYW